MLDNDSIHFIKDLWSVAIGKHIVKLAPAFFTGRHLKQRGIWQAKFSNIPPKQHLIDFAHALEIQGAKYVFRDPEDPNVYAQFSTEADLHNTCHKTIDYLNRKIRGLPCGIEWSNWDKYIKDIPIVPDNTLDHPHQISHNTDQVDPKTNQSMDLDISSDQSTNTISQNKARQRQQKVTVAGSLPHPWYPNDNAEASCSTTMTHNTNTTEHTVTSQDNSQQKKEDHKEKNKEKIDPPTAKDIHKTTPRTLVKSYNKQISAPKLKAKSFHNKQIANTRMQDQRTYKSIHNCATGSNRIPINANTTRLCQSTKVNKFVEHLDHSSCNPSPTDVEMAESWDNNPWASSQSQKKD